ncbi:hypothetical protein BN166_2750001 [Clostridioides difficile E10]|nr:hypothetical protein BN166_2750001 [Clostridioides difficile E10]
MVCKYWYRYNCYKCINRFILTMWNVNPRLIFIVKLLSSYFRLTIWNVNAPVPNNVINNPISFRLTIWNVNSCKHLILLLLLLEFYINYVEKN